MTVTLTEAQTHLAAWLAADLAVAKGQSFELNGRKITLSNADEIGKKISFWQRQVTRLQGVASNRRVGPFSTVARLS